MFKKKIVLRQIYSMGNCSSQGKKHKPENLGCCGYPSGFYYWVEMTFFPKQVALADHWFDLG